MESHSFAQDHKQFEFKILRSKKRRKTIAIHVSKKKGVEVKVPYATTMKRILALVEERSHWIYEKLTKLQNQPEPELKAWHEGDNLWFLGINYPLHIETFPFHKKKAECVFDHKKFTLVVAQKLNEKERKDVIIQTLEAWYREEALKILTERTEYFARLMQVKNKKIIVKAQKHRWGSCDRYNNIRYNWKIIMCALEIIDYLVVHELAHIKFKNHSKKFWGFVESILPDQDQRRKDLCEFGRNFIL